MYNYTEAMENLIRHIIGACPQFSHIRTDELIISYTQTRTSGVNGVYASVVPLRFENGSRTTIRRKRTYKMPEIIREGKEILYIIYFALPRFIDLDFETKLTTVFHELYHISPDFNGDIRRFPGKNYAHGHSRRKYNEQMKVLMGSYLNEPGAREASEFLNHKFSYFDDSYKGIIGRRVTLPKARPVVS